MLGSPLPLLSIGCLRAAGVFAISPKSIPGTAVTWEAALSGLSGHFRYDDTAEKLWCDLKNGEHERNWLIETRTAKLAYGRRRYFVCPTCAKRCEDLILVNDGHCRECYRTCRSVLDRRHREALLVYAEQAIKSGHWSIKKITNDFRKPDGIARVEAKRVAADRCPEVRHDNQTSVALDRGRGMLDWQVFDLYKGFGIGDLLAMPSGVEGFDPPARGGLITDFPLLNINQVRQKLAGSNSGFRAQTLAYGADHPQIVVGLFYDCRFGEPMVVIAHQPFDADQPRWQRLTIVAQPRKRFRWHCPVTEDNFDTLYLRNGIFASRPAQRLVPKSQRGARRRGRAHDKAEPL